MHNPDNKTTLATFYSTVTETIPARRTISADILKGISPDAEQIRILQQCHQFLQCLPESDDSNPMGKKLYVDDDIVIPVDLSYEIGELERDIIYLTQGESALISFLESRQPSLKKEIAAGRKYLHNRHCDLFISDRDGTVNNYCGRYQSSVQSIYNAVFLSRFAEKCSSNAMILTSAPLKSPGILDISVGPPGRFIFGASKGREFLDLAGKRHSFPIDPEKQQVLDRFYTMLDEALQKPQWRKHRLIGSGLQRKFGQITVARQDVTASIPAVQSARFLETVQELVKQADPEECFLRIEDTGYDIEIILSIDSSKSARDFDKGDGLRFIAEELEFDLQQGTRIVCGDTPSDIPLIDALTPSDELYPIFVSTDTKLIQQVQSRHPETLILSTPDSLVLLLNEIAKEE
ncbi:MAG: hypothetical protein ACOCVC_08730 [Spirochaeta sp.]